MSERGCWVYGVTDRDPDVAGLTGVAGEPVVTAPAGSLTALVSDVDLDEFGEDAMARNLEDLDWLESVARAHHHVIETASRRLPVLPVGLTTVYSTRDGMAEALGEREEEFLDGLALVRDRVEWGVKAYARPEKPQPKPSSPAAGGKGSGLDYLKRRREQLDTQRESRRDTARAARDAHAALAGQAIRVRLHPPQSPQLSGSDAPMLLNAAYLLDRADESGFPDAVAAVADAHPELRLELTGPWPPYSFAGEPREPEEAGEPEGARP